MAKKKPAHEPEEVYTRPPYISFDDEMEKAMEEARRFLQKAEEHAKRLQAYQRHVKEHANVRVVPPHQTRAAVRRASMDLTRALAKMRRGGA